MGREVTDGAARIMWNQNKAEWRIPIGASRTWCLWYLPKPTAAGSIGVLWGKASGSGGANAWRVDGITTNRQFGFVGSGLGSKYTVVETLIENVWNFLVVTLDGSTIRLYQSLAGEAITLTDSAGYTQTQLTGTDTKMAQGGLTSFTGFEYLGIGAEYSLFTRTLSIDELECVKHFGAICMNKGDLVFYAPLWGTGAEGNSPAEPELSGFYATPSNSNTIEFGNISAVHAPKGPYKTPNLAGQYSFLQPTLPPTRIIVPAIAYSRGTKAREISDN